MPADSSSPSGPPDQNTPLPPDTSSEATEADLWNLDEEMAPKPSAQPTPRDQGRRQKSESSAESAAHITGGKTPRRTNTPPADREKDPLQAPAQVQAGPREMEDEIGYLDDQDAGGEVLDVFADDDDEVVTLTEQDTPTDRPARAAAPSAVNISKREPDAETLAQQAAMRESREARRKATDEAARAPKPGIARRDVVSLGIFAFVILLAGIWVLSRFFTQVYFKESFVEDPSYPIKGEYVTLAQGDTFWRAPIREGENRDSARREVAMIPVLDLTLDPAASTAGALRIIFRNAQGTTVGDSITRSFTAGNFDASGSPQISFPATDGFNEEGNFNGYRTETGPPWMADVLEGPSVNAPAGSFKLLVQIPIRPKSR